MVFHSESYNIIYKQVKKRKQHQIARKILKSMFLHTLTKAMAKINWKNSFPKAYFSPILLMFLLLVLFIE